MALAVKNLPTNAGDERDMGSTGLGRSPGGGHGKSLNYSCLENPMEPGGLHLKGHKELDVTEVTCCCC